MIRVNERIGIAVNGVCPMGCGDTLSFIDGDVRCVKRECPRPLAATELLNLSPDHVVTFGDLGYTVEHPSSERIEGTMHECEFHTALMGLEEAPMPNGRYRMVKRPHDPTSSSFRSDGLEYDFEPLGEEAE